MTEQEIKDACKTLLEGKKRELTTEEKELLNKVSIFQYDDEDESKGELNNA